MRNTGIGTAGLLLALLACPVQNAPAAPSLLLMEFEIIDDLGDAASAVEDRRRLNEATRQLHAALAACGRFELAAPAADSTALDAARAQNHYLHRCNGCTRAIAEPAGAELVLFPWVQKVSNLILNVNAEIRYAQTEATVMTRSVDIRANNDVSWQRGVRALARRLCPGALD
ncbi:MAG TPA: DUF3280 domain-containing protein [Burkholderiales bacterium]|nr:DUF3280 domain-containing protein [Burkholderiales bacterium]